MDQQSIEVGGTNQRPSIPMGYHSYEDGSVLAWLETLPGVSGGIVRADSLPRLCHGMIWLMDRLFLTEQRRREEMIATDTFGDELQWAWVGIKEQNKLLVYITSIPKFGIYFLSDAQMAQWFSELLRLTLQIHQAQPVYLPNSEPAHCPECQQAIAWRRVDGMAIFAVPCGHRLGTAL